MNEIVKRGPGRPRKAKQEVDGAPANTGGSVAIILERNYFIRDSEKILKGERIVVPDDLAWSLIERNIGRRA